MTQLRDVPTMICVDVANLYFSGAKMWGRKLNYEMLANKLKEENSQIRAMNAYASFRRHYAPFITVLRNLGFSVQHKLIDSYLPHVSWVSQITIDTLCVDSIDKYIFLTNDFGLIPLYQYLAKHNRYVEVWSPNIPLAISQSVNDTFQFGESFCGKAIPTSQKAQATIGSKPS